MVDTQYIWHFYGIAYLCFAIEKWKINVLYLWCSKKTLNKSPSQPKYVVLSEKLSCYNASGNGIPANFVVNYFRWYQLVSNKSISENIYKNELQQEILLFPGPVEDCLNISILEDLKVNKLDIINGLGQKIFSKNVELDIKSINIS